MITEEQVQNTFKWFDQYVMKFNSSDNEFQRNIDLKYYHIFRVIDNITEICNHTGLSEEKTRLARIIGLFHDIGRFKQLAQYGTFADKKSEDHAHIGVSELHKHNAFDIFENKDAEIIKTAINNHNKKTVAEDIQGEALMFAKLIRDADKIDIYKVITDYCTNPDQETNSTLQLDLPDIPEYQQSIAERILRNKLVSLDHLKTFNDFKLLQISWIYDFNFPASLEIIKSRRYIETLISTLPQDEIIHRLQSHVLQFIEKHAYSAY